MDQAFFIREGIFVKNTGAKGRGLFTRNNIVADEVIEVSPVIVMDAAARALLDQTLLHDYIFEWQPDGEPQCCMAMGYVPIYNHSYTSNCEYFMDYETNTMSIKAARDIAAQEELTINYNGDWDDAKPVWFEVGA